MSAWADQVRRLHELAAQMHDKRDAAGLRIEAENMRLAAPAAPVGDEGRQRCESCGRAVPWPTCAFCRQIDAERAPGDEGAARAAVARVLALCDEADEYVVAMRDVVNLHPQAVDGLSAFAALTLRLRAALSAVSGEHRDAEDGQ